jgi:hypothetical protein
MFFYLGSQQYSTWALSHSFTNDIRTKIIYTKDSYLLIS